jgi:hypothetical protein
MKDERLLIAAACATLSLALMGASCETVHPAVKAQSDVPSAGKFPHGIFGRFLERVVQDGLVDYAAASLEEAKLEEYLAEVARVSPDSHRHLFPTEPDQLAYWINAHNACAIRGVLRFNRPQTLKGIEHRFDSETKYVLGGHDLSLNQISAIASKRFTDARVHFALVKARRGGPPLAKDPWDASDLDERLEAAAKAFVADPLHVDWKAPALKAGFSRVILDFRGDFEREVPSTVSGDPRLIGSINRWRVRTDKVTAIEITPIPFDERLNDAANR